mmetsp:Transcript_17970/g.25400  ORF Transcript_17970/g.25400 Transcript_17970/m.25400 type:complete len:139 (-) Transcript_17970:1023-1439(-)
MSQSAVSKISKEEESPAHEIVPLSVFANNVLFVDPRDRNAYIIAYMLTDKTTNFKVEDLKAQHWLCCIFLKPSRKLFLKEVKRRGCRSKGILNYTLNHLINYLQTKSMLIECNLMYTREQFEIIRNNLLLNASNVPNV